MKTRLLFFLTFLFSTTILCGQTFNIKYFSKTDWFSNNKDSAFYKSDTIRIIQHCNFGPAWASKEYAEYEMKYLKTGDFVEFGFQKHSNMYFSERYNNELSVCQGGHWSWNFDKTNIFLKIFYNDKLISTFQPISVRQIKIDSRFADQKDLLTTNEVTLIRIK